jgi:ABC-type nitrate/sulfonate/bicarbonate transport system permease component
LASAGLVSTFLVPSPAQVAARIPSLFLEERLIGRLAETGMAVLVAIGLATLIGGWAGWVLYRRPSLWQAFAGWFVALNATPVVLLYPLFLAIIGRGPVTVILLGVLGALPPIALKTREAFAGVRPVLLAVGRCFDLTGAQRFRLIELPAALPVIAAGFRMSTFYAVTTVIGAEFLTGAGGLGALIPDLAERFDLPAMYGAMALIVVASASFLAVVRRVEAWLR